jgi:hypothetical protein
VLTAELTRAVDAVEVAPLAGRALRVIIAGGHHAELFNAIVSAADRYLADHQVELRERFQGESPRWLPDAAYRLVFDRLYNRLRQRLAGMAADPDDEARRQFEEWIGGLPSRLETSPELRERGERLKRDILGSAELRDWSSSLWRRAKDALRTQAADPESELRRQLTAALVAAGQRLGSDRRLQEGLERVVESGARALADQFHDELADLVTGTIERWDAAETSSQLELLLGPDLQYIRINGTVVGAGVGLALHAIAMARADDGGWPYGAAQAVCVTGSLGGIGHRTWPQAGSRRVTGSGPLDEFCQPTRRPQQQDRSHRPPSPAPQPDRNQQISRPPGGIGNRCVPLAGGAEAAALSQFGALGFGVAGLRRRRIRNPGSLLSFS